MHELFFFFWGGGEAESEPTEENTMLPEVSDDSGERTKLIFVTEHKFLTTASI